MWHAANLAFRRKTATDFLKSSNLSAKDETDLTNSVPELQGPTSAKEYKVMHRAHNAAKLQSCHPIAR